MASHRSTLMESLLDCNPNKGRPPYQSGGDVNKCIDLPCEMQSLNVPDDTLGNADNSTVEPETPPTVCIVDLTNNSQETYTYNGQSYSSPDGGSLTYNVTSGYILSTSFGNYTKAQNRQSPFGTYCQGDNVVVAVDCDKQINFNEPEVQMAECVEVVYNSVDETALGTFEPNDLDIWISGDMAGTIQFNDPWELTIGTVVYTGGNDESNPSGLFRNENGDCILIKECQT